MYCRLLHFSTLHCKLSTSQGVPYIIFHSVQAAIMKPGCLLPEQAATQQHRPPYMLGFTYFHHQCLNLQNYYTACQYLTKGFLSYLWPIPLLSTQTSLLSLYFWPRSSSLSWTTFESASLALKGVLYLYVIFLCVLLILLCDQIPHHKCGMHRQFVSPQFLSGRSLAHMSMT